METKSPISSAIKAGLLAGIAGIIFTLLIYIAGIDLQSKIRYFGMLILIGGIVYGTIIHRDNDLNGYMSYGRGLGIGTLTALFYGLIISIFSYVLFTIIDPGLVAQMLEMQEDALAEQGLDDEMIEQQMSIVGKFMNPVIMSVMAFFLYIISGFILSLIISAILKKNPPQAGTLDQ